MTIDVVYRLGHTSLLQCRATVVQAAIGQDLKFELRRCLFSIRRRLHARNLELYVRALNAVVCDVSKHDFNLVRVP